MVKLANLDPQDMRDGEVEQPIDSICIADEALAVGSVARICEHLKQQVDLLTPRLMAELENISFGRLIRESSEPMHVVKPYRRQLKEIFGAKTDAQLVARAAQTGTLAIEVDPNSQLFPLSRMQDSALRLWALGSTANEIAEYYKSSSSSVDSYFRKIRERLPAQNNKHAVRRAFETGIFKVGEDILDPEAYMEQQTGGLAIAIGDQEFKPRHLGLYHPREIELLELIARHQQSVFKRADIYALGFYDDAENARIREKAFHRHISNICSKLGAGADQSVLQRFGRNGSGTYVFMQESTFKVGDESVTIPKGSPPNTRNYGRPRKISSVAQRIAKQVQPRVAVPTPKRTIVESRSDNTKASPQKKKLTQADIDRIKSRTHVNGTKVLGTPEVKGDFVIVRLESTTGDGAVKEGSEAAKAIINGFRKGKKRNFSSGVSAR